MNDAFYLKLFAVIAVMVCVVTATVCVRDVLIEQIRCEQTK